HPCLPGAVDVRMKSGGPWNLRGLHPEARAAARDAARRSGMSVGEWLNSVVEPTEAEDDETWRPADAEERFADRSARRSKEEFRERDAQRQPEPSRREDRSDERRRKSRQDDNRMFEQDRDRLPRHRDRESDAPQWRASGGESEPGTRHRNRRHRFRDREADESPSQYVPAAD